MKAICSTYKNHGIHRVRIKVGRGNGKARNYSPEQLTWLYENYRGRGYAEIAEMFTAEFGIARTSDQIKTFIGNRHLNTGRTGCFEKGITPWNKGRKGYMGANVTSFKTGNVPANIKPLWDERICSKDGFILMKVPERDPHTGFPTRYKHKHVWVWEQANGPVPEGFAIAFKDSNKLHCDLDNLMLVSRAELLHLVLHHYKDQPDEIKPTILAIAKLEVKAGFRSTGRQPGAGRKKKALHI